MEVENDFFGRLEHVERSFKIPRLAMPIDSNWRKPQFKDLRGYERICLDVETYDPSLKTHGAGWASGDGYVCGIAVAVNDWSGYFPLGHDEDNMDRGTVVQWLNDQLRTPKYVVGHNLPYDLGWLWATGIELPRDTLYHDTQICEMLLDDIERFGRGVSLSDTLKKYYQAGKNSDELYRWLHNLMGKGMYPSEKELRKAVQYIRHAPPKLAGPYAQSDVEGPLKIVDQQLHALKYAGMMQVFEMECALLPIMRKIRSAGVRVSKPKAEVLEVELVSSIEEATREIYALAGETFNTGASSEVGRVFTKLGIPFQRTEKTQQPKLSKEAMMEIEHPLAEKIVAVQSDKKFLETFVRGYILNKSGDSARVHGTIDPSGTVTGRMSSNSPNLQNIPSKGKLAKLIRSMFVPDEGHYGWMKMDYKGVESRLLGHFARGIRADELRQQYAEDAMTDYHDWTQAMIERMLGIKVDRKGVKGINFGLTYGMGKSKLIRGLAAFGINQNAGESLFEAYHAALPYMKTTMQWAADTASTFQSIRTVMDRRTKFHYWEPLEGSKQPPLRKKAAMAAYGHALKLSSTHKALNYVIQGSAADLMKKAIVDADKEGLFDLLGYPRLIVHDELDFSVCNGNREAWERLVEIMETCIPKITVPLIVECEYGASWGETESLNLRRTA